MPSRGSIVDLDGAAPAPPPTRRDRAVLGALAGGCLALGLVVLVARAPAPLGHPIPATQAPIAAPTPPALRVVGRDTPGAVWIRLDKSGMATCLNVPQSEQATIPREICVYRPVDDPDATDARGVGRMPFIPVLTRP